MLRIVLMGDENTGKSMLVGRLTKKDDFHESYVPTIGLEFARYEDPENPKKKIHFWDLAGQERFRVFTTAYTKNANGVVLLLDGTKPHEAQRKQLATWMKSIATNTEKPCPLFIVYSKSDVERFAPLPEGDLMAAYTDIRSSLDHAKHLTENPRYFTCSAKTGENVEALLEALRSIALTTAPMGTFEVETSTPRRLTEKQRASYTRLFAIKTVAPEDQRPATRVAQLFEDYDRHGRYLWRLRHPGRHHQDLARTIAEHLRRPENATLTREGIETYINELTQRGSVVFDPEGSFMRRFHFALDTLEQEERAKEAVAPVISHL